MSERLSSLLAAKKFPGRSMLRVQEVAAVFDVDDAQVVNWTEDGQLGYCNIGANPDDSKRKSRRIPVDEYDNFLTRRFSIKPNGNGKATRV